MVHFPLGEGLICDFKIMLEDDKSKYSILKILIPKMYYTLLKKSEKGQFRVILLKCSSEPYDVAFCSKSSQASCLLQNKKWFLPQPIRPHAPGRSLPYLLDLFSCSPPPCHVFPWCWLSKGETQISKCPPWPKLSWALLVSRWETLSLSLYNLKAHFT